MSGAGGLQDRSCRPPVLSWIRVGQGLMLALLALPCWSAPTALAAALASDKAAAAPVMNESLVASWDLWGALLQDLPLDPSVRQQLDRQTARLLPMTVEAARDHQRWMDKNQPTVSPFQRLLWTRIWLVNHRTLGLLSLPEAERLAAVDDLIRAAASGEDCRAREGLLQGLPRAPGATDPWTPADVDRWLGREEQAWHAASDARAIERPPRELAEQLAGLWIRAEQPGSGLVLPKPALRSVDSFAVTAEGGLQLLVCQVFPRFWLHLKTGPAAERDEFARAVLWASADTQMDEVLVPVDTPDGQPRVDGDDYPHAARVLWLTGEVRVKVVLDAEDRPVRASVVARPAPPVWLRGDAPVVLDRLFDNASIKRAMHQPYARRPAGAAAGERTVLIAYQWRLAD